MLFNTYASQIASNLNYTYVTSPVNDINQSFIYLLLLFCVLLVNFYFV